MQLWLPLPHSCTFLFCWAELVFLLWPEDWLRESRNPLLMWVSEGTLQEGVFICSGWAACVKETEVTRVLYYP